MKIEKSYTVQIWVGLRARYGHYYFNLNDVRQICDEFVNELDENGLGDCVTITPTEYRYVKSWEPGAIVGFVNYPRFPRSSEKLTEKALALAERLRKGLKQFRVTVVTPDNTYMLEDEQA